MATAAESAARESERRFALWRGIEETAASGVEPARLRELGIYGAYQGVWVDKAVTGHLGPSGAAVAVLHTGQHYSDYLSEDDLLYNYPTTKRRGKDAAETEAIKNAGLLQLPVFVLLPLTSEGLRPVRLGWIADWDDEAKHCLIVFGRQPAGMPGVSTTAENPFVLHDNGAQGVGKRKVRPSQQKFRFDVLRRYGTKCCVCSTAHPELLVAAHICGKKQRGCDDPRNGMPLCYTHHAAFDASMFSIHPETLALERHGASFQSMGVTEETLQPLRNRPHEIALRWRYDWRRQEAP